MTRLSDLLDRGMRLIVRAYFTKTNVLAHLLIYPLIMKAEGGDFHLFLDGISIEAVFVGLLVGISTKHIVEHHGGLAKTLAHLVHLHEKQP